MRLASSMPAPDSRLLPAALALSILGAGAAGPGVAGTSQENKKSVSEEVAAAASDTSGGKVAGREWLVDESGQEYRIEKIPKVEGSYKWMDEEQKRVLLPLGARFEVVKHDDDWFWVKDLKPRAPLPRREKKDDKPSAEKVAEVESRYRVELGESDRLAFEEFDRGLPRSGQWRNGFDIADMNEDGHLDVVFGPSRKGRMLPNVFLGDSQGGWRPWREASFPPLPYDYGDAEAADFNVDGHMDLAFGIHLRGMAVIVGDGRGGFTPWTEGIGLSQPGKGGDISTFSSRAVSSVDWNGDGHLDLLALGEGPKGAPTRARGTPTQVDSSSRGFLVYLSRGDGTWVPWRPLQGTGLRPTFGDAFVLADFNRDEIPDLVSGSRQMGSKEILRVGREGGKFDVAKIDAVPPGAMVSAVATDDLDGDGNADLILGYMNRELGVWRTGIDVLYGAASDLTWKRRALHSEESRRGVTALATGNLDGDARPDLVALTGRGEVWVFLADGEGWFVWESEDLMPAEQGCQGFGLALVDLDGDRRDEVVASFAGEVTGMPGLPGLSHPGCTDEGSVRAWKATTRAR